MLTNENVKSKKRYNVVQKLRVLRNDKTNGFMLMDINGKYVLINKHERLKNLYKRNDIVYVWITQIHDKFDYAKYTIDGIPILDQINEFKDLKALDINAMMYEDKMKDLRHFIISVIDNDSGIIKEIKKGKILDFHPDLEEMQKLFMATDKMEIKHITIAINYLYKKFKDKENRIL